MLVQTGHDTDDNHFYLHDLLGSVRQVVDSSGTVRNIVMYRDWLRNGRSQIRINGQSYNSAYNF